MSKQLRIMDMEFTDQGEFDALPRNSLVVFLAEGKYYPTEPFPQIFLATKDEIEYGLMLIRPASMSGLLRAILANFVGVNGNRLLRLLYHLGMVSPKQCFSEKTNWGDFNFHIARNIRQKKALKRMSFRPDQLDDYIKSLMSDGY